MCSAPVANRPQT